jgi:hypothetical protein
MDRYQKAPVYDVVLFIGSWVACIFAFSEAIWGEPHWVMRAWMLAHAAAALGIAWFAKMQLGVDENDEDEKWWTIIWYAFLLVGLYSLYRVFAPMKHDPALWVFLVAWLGIAGFVSYCFSEAAKDTKTLQIG